MITINKIEIDALSFPLEKPFSNHVKPITAINGIYIKIHADTEIGHGLIYGLSNIEHKKIFFYLESEIMPFFFNLQASNCDVLKFKWTAYWLNYKNRKLKPDQLYALSVIDVAIWDIFLKSKGISLYQCLGASQKKITAYATTGWLSLNNMELVEECQKYRAEGINAFKLRLGHLEDFSRIALLRKVMGANYLLMLDANQRLYLEYQ